MERHLRRVDQARSRFEAARSRVVRLAVDTATSLANSTERRVRPVESRIERVLNERGNRGFEPYASFTPPVGVASNVIGSATPGESSNSGTSTMGPSEVGIEIAPGPSRRSDPPASNRPLNMSTSSAGPAEGWDSLPSYFVRRRGNIVLHRPDSASGSTSGGTLSPSDRRRRHPNVRIYSSSGYVRLVTVRFWTGIAEVFNLVLILERR